MKPRDYVLFYLASLLVLIAVAAFQHSPGYMDADYYQLTGQQLAQGAGFSEPVVWNYLDDPQGLPHPSHAYWPPLPSLIAAGGMRLFGESFAGGRAFFILLSAAIAPLTAALAMELTGKRGLARLAGWLAVMPGFYLPYLSTTDSFGVSMVLGAAFFLVLAKRQGELTSRGAFSLGVIAGLMYLNRAEGLLWGLAAIVTAWIVVRKPRNAVLALAGFVVVAGTWMVRTWLIFGSLFSPAAGRTLWLTSYDELFAYPAGQLTFDHWFASGWGAIISSRLSALGQNLLGAIAVEGHIFLFPLVVWGMWQWRNQRVVQIAIAVWLGLFLTMSLVYPFSGARGGFFHAAAVLQPIVWVLAAIGLSAFAEWGGTKRGWNTNQAAHVFSAAALLFALALTAFVAMRRLPEWNAGATHYAQLGARLDEVGVANDAIVMVNNPPGFALATDRAAIVIPNGGVNESLTAAGHFEAAILLLESNHPLGWNDIYAMPQLNAKLIYVESFDGTHIFLIP